MREEERDVARDQARAHERAETLRRSIDAREARIAIVGLGSVGLPLGAAFVDAGFDVLGFDVDIAKLARLEHGENTLHHLADGHVRSMLATGRFHVTADPERLSACPIAIVCVPTPLAPNREPDLACVVDAGRTLAAHLAPGALVVLESTTYPGTTRRVLGDLFRARALEPATDVFLAYSPEREDPGRNVRTASIPKIVGGTCAHSGDLAQRLYAAAVERVHRVSSAEVAESAKLLENVFRAVNIALVNELKVALEAMQIDVWEVIDAAATKPFGFMKFTPGPGMGGHCIPIDPFYLSWIAKKSGVETRFIELAGEISREMPHWVVERTRTALASVGKDIVGARILILGLAYKPDVDIVTESPSIRLIEIFEALGAEASYSDPLVPRCPKLEGHEIGERASVALDARVLASFDAVVVSTNHSAFDWEAIAAHARIVVDTRNALDSRLHGAAHYFKA